WRHASYWIPACAGMSGRGASTRTGFALTSRPRSPHLQLRRAAASMSLPLSGLLVVSLEQAVAAPMCTCRLTDAGARVIKVQRPEGDFARYYDKLGVPRARSAPSPHSILPSPSWGGSPAEAQRRRAGWGSELADASPAATATPTPNPSPQGG